MYRRPRLRRHKFIPSDTRIDENTAIHGHFIRYRYGRLNVLSSSVLFSPGTDFHAVVQPERVHFAQTKKVYVPPVVLRNTFTTMNFPPEIYEHILFYLPLPDLIRAGRTCRSFYQISRWCLESKEYIGRWRVSFQENGGTRRIIPIDLDKSERRLEKEGGFYVFNARIKPISWMNEILQIDLAFLNLRVLSFGLRFMDHGDLSPSEDIESNPPLHLSTPRAHPRATFTRISIVFTECPTLRMRRTMWTIHRLQSLTMDNNTSNSMANVSHET
jgi:hypothetical protein